MVEDINSMQQLESRFSDELIKRSKVIFEKRAKRELNDGEVEYFLDRLAVLGDIALKVYSQEQEALRSQEAANK